MVANKISAIEKKRRQILRKSYQLNKELINAITEIRTSLHWTQGDLTDLTDICQSMISRIENGISNPQLQTLLLILAAMHYKIIIVPLESES